MAGPEPYPVERDLREIKALAQEYLEAQIATRKAIRERNVHKEFTKLHGRRLGEEQIEESQKEVQTAFTKLGEARQRLEQKGIVLETLEEQDKKIEDALDTMEAKLSAFHSPKNNTVIPSQEAAAISSTLSVLETYLTPAIPTPYSGMCRTAHEFLNDLASPLSNKAPNEKNQRNTKVRFLENLITELRREFRNAS